MARAKKGRHNPEDQWTTKLLYGGKAEYRSKRLLSGRYKISAGVVGTNLSHSRIVDYPVSRADVETVFLSDLVDLVA